MTFAFSSLVPERDRIWKSPSNNMIGTHRVDWLNSDVTFFSVTNDSSNPMWGPETGQEERRDAFCTGVWQLIQWRGDPFTPLQTSSSASQLVAPLPGIGCPVAYATCQQVLATIGRSTDLRTLHMYARQEASVSFGNGTARTVKLLPWELRYIAGCAAFCERRFVLAMHHACENIRHNPFDALSARLALLSWFFWPDGAAEMTAALLHAALARVPHPSKSQSAQSQSTTTTSLVDIVAAAAASSDAMNANQDARRYDDAPLTAVCCFVLSLLAFGLEETTERNPDRNVTLATEGDDMRLDLLTGTLDRTVSLVDWLEANFPSSSDPLSPQICNSLKMSFLVISACDRLNECVATSNGGRDQKGSLAHSVTSSWLNDGRPCFTVPYAVHAVCHCFEVLQVPTVALRCFEGTDDGRIACERRVSSSSSSSTVAIVGRRIPPAVWESCVHLRTHIHWHVALFHWMSIDRCLLLLIRPPAVQGRDGQDDRLSSSTSVIESQQLRQLRHAWVGVGNVYDAHLAANIIGHSDPFQLCDTVSLLARLWITACSTASTMNTSETTTTSEHWQACEFVGLAKRFVALRVPPLLACWTRCGEATGWPADAMRLTMGQLCGRDPSQMSSGPITAATEAPADLLVSSPFHLFFMIHWLICGALFLSSGAADIHRRGHEEAEAQNALEILFRQSLENLDSLNIPTETPTKRRSATAFRSIATVIAWTLGDHPVTHITAGQSYSAMELAAIGGSLAQRDLFVRLQLPRKALAVEK